LKFKQIKSNFVTFLNLKKDLKKEVDMSKPLGTEMPLDIYRPLVSHDPNNLPSIQMPKAGYRPVKTTQVAPVEIHEAMKVHEAMMPHATPQTRFAPTVDSQLSLASWAEKKQNPKVDVKDFDDPRSKYQKAQSMRDPSDSATERSKAFNTFYGLFFASGGLYVGYALAILNPLGDKWLKFNFGITDDAAVLLGMANLV
jgi:hypothetical protein